ncbi:MAG: 2-hydroxyacyl-CoA dehydratase [Dehalococcoidales bacterium]|nr:2-hydroxyacyl-CoA dehydratase [Dehalococcoidales bacterium]
MSDITPLWQELSMDLERYEKLLSVITKIHADIFVTQSNRPRGMKYFDRMVSGLPDKRIMELLEHKKKGGKVAGTFCLFAPEEIIHAAGGITVRLEGGTQFPIPDAETVLPNDICPMIKSTFGLKLSKISPYFQVVDFLIGETSCDGKKKVWEILNDYVPVHVMELPQKKNQQDRDLWLKECQELKEKMEAETGIRITPERLSRSIEIFNAKRKSLARLQALRRKSPPPISGRDAVLISQVACYDDPERFTARVNALCDELEKTSKKGPGQDFSGLPRILITGCPMALPNWKIPYIVESGGAVVVGEDTCLGSRYFMSPLIYTEESDTLAIQLKAISERYLKLACPSFTPGYCGVLQMTEMVESFKPAGVIYYVLQFCHGFNIEFSKMEKELKQVNMPVLRIQSDYGREDTGQLRTRVEAFLERVSGR